MIDIHCHILPGVDDGASSLAESIAMAKTAAADGIHTIVATPHTLNESHRNPYSLVSDRAARLREVLSKELPALDLRIGSDAHLCHGLTQKVLNNEAVTINENGRYLLVEFPVFAIPPGATEELFQLKLNNIIPIITHPERNLAFQQNMEILYELIAMGCLIQVTAMSITGGFGEDAMEFSHRLLENRLAHVIASDAHSADKRPPVLSPAVEAAAHIMGSESEANAMVLDRPRAILEGKQVQVPEPGRPKKRWFFR